MTTCASSSPHLAVIVCTRNRAALLDQTLASLRRQDVPASFWEILVVDNGSTDGTREVVQSHQRVWSELAYLREPRAGLSRARNAGLLHTRAPLVAYLDDDVLLCPQWVQAITAPFLLPHHPPLGCVGGEVIPIFPEGVPAWQARWHQPLRLRADAGFLGDTQFPMGANFAFRRDALLAAGAFNLELGRCGERLFSGEDREAVHKVRALGYRCWFTPDAEVLHQMPAQRTEVRHLSRLAFDSARSRVQERRQQSQASWFLASRSLGHLPLLVCHALLTAVGFLCGSASLSGKGAVRCARSSGYLWAAFSALFPARRSLPVPLATHTSRASA